MDCVSVPRSNETGKVISIHLISGKAIFRRITHYVPDFNGNAKNGVGGSEQETRLFGGEPDE